MAALPLIKRMAPLAPGVELLAIGAALTYGGELWLHSLHLFSGVPQDWSHMVSESTVELPLVILAIWATRAAMGALLSRRAQPLPRLALNSLFALGMTLAACVALLLDGLSTDLFYPELSLTGTNPFLCTVFSFGVEAAVTIPGMDAAYDALVTLPAMLLIAAAIAFLRPLRHAPQGVSA